MLRRIFAALMTLLLHGGAWVDADDLLDDLDDSAAAGRRRHHVHAAPPVASSAGSAGPAETRSSHPLVGLIALPAIDAAAPDGRLADALAACRERGDLKVQVLAPHADPGVIRRACAAHGFTFSRVRESAAGSVLEFYTDLYFIPPHRAAAG